jgi:hypothetical protein
MATTGIEERKYLLGREKTLAAAHRVIAQEARYAAEEGDQMTADRLQSALWTLGAAIESNARTISRT